VLYNDDVRRKPLLFGRLGLEKWSCAIEVILPISLNVVVQIDLTPLHVDVISVPVNEYAVSEHFDNVFVGANLA